MSSSICARSFKALRASASERERLHVCVRSAEQVKAILFLQGFIVLESPHASIMIFNRG